MDANRKLIGNAAFLGKLACKLKWGWDCRNTNKLVFFSDKGNLITSCERDTDFA